MEQKFKIGGLILLLGFTLASTTGNAESLRQTTIAQPQAPIWSPVQDPNRRISATVVPSSQDQTGAKALPLDQDEPPEEEENPPEQSGELAQGKPQGPIERQAVEAGQPIERDRVKAEEPSDGTGEAAVPPVDPSTTTPQQPLAQAPQNPGESNNPDFETSAITGGERNPTAPALPSGSSAMTGMALEGAGCSMAPSNESPNGTLEVVMLALLFVGAYRLRKARLERRASINFAPH